MDKIKIDTEIPQLGVQTTGEIPEIELKADGETPLISLNKQDYQACHTLRMIEETEHKKQRKYDFYVATFSTIFGVFLGNLDRIIKLIKELISVLEDLLKAQ